jgi:hypothetical protein
MSNSSFPNAQSNPAGAIPVYFGTQPSGAGKTGLSASGSVTTGSTTIVTAGQFPNWVTLANSSTGGQTINISFGATATTSDFPLLPGGAITFPFGLANSIQAIASASGATFAAVGA